MIMVSWNNLDTLASYKELAGIKKVSVKEVMSGDNGAKRVKEYSVPMACGMAFNYAAKAVDDDVLKGLVKLADEAQLADKFAALYNGEVINTGEKRLVLHQLTRGQLGDDVVADGVNKREFYVGQQKKIADFAAKVHDGSIANGKGEKFTSAIDGIQASYDADVTDEFVKPIVITDAAGAPLATVEEGDAIIFYNFRNDRARELTTVLTQKDMPEEGMKTLPLYYCCLTPYDANFTGVHILFDKELVNNTLGETVSKAGKRQLRIAETEKYAHVTFFFNGGRELQFENEDRILVNSPKVPTYDLLPEMSAPEVAEKLVDVINTEKEDMIILNFANGDMVGHTGVYTSIERAVACIDKMVEKVVTAAKEHGYVVLLTADHGNADYAVNPDGTPNTAHSLNIVPFIVINAENEVKTVKDGALCNVAPTILKLMGIPQPAEMTAEPLF